jgi:hypothetical protein
MKQNITLSLDKSLIQKARVIAAQRNTSISKLLAEELERTVSQTEHYDAAKRQAMADLAKGLRLGGNPAARDELHAR